MFVQKKFAKATDLHISLSHLRLATWIKEMAYRGFPRTTSQIKEAVKSYLDKCKLKINNFNDNRPGRTWFYGFLRRHPDLKMSKAEKLEISRAMACSEESVMSWFQEFRSILAEYNINSPDQIYNCDESGFPLQSKNSLKVCTDKWVKRTFQITSANKVSISTLQCICANGNVVPPAVLFPGKKMNAEYALGFPKNFHIGFTENGWMDTTQFYGWLVNHFVKKIPATRPVLLLLDGHSSHIDYHISKFCKDEGIILFKFPPHTSHVLQPTDRCFFAQFKSNFQQSASKFAVENPGMTTTKRTFSTVFVDAYIKSCRAESVIGSFKSSGIWPVNENAIDKKIFLPAKTFRDCQLVENLNETPEVDMQVQPSTSTAKKPACKSKHPTYLALKALEGAIGISNISLYEHRLSSDTSGTCFKDDALFQSWKGLKLEWQKVQKIIDDESFCSSNNQSDYSKILDDVLEYPTTVRKQPRKNKKQGLPLNLSCEKSLEILEVIYDDKNKKEIEKEARRVRKEKKNKPNHNDNKENEKKL